MKRPIQILQVVLLTCVMSIINARICRADGTSSEDLVFPILGQPLNDRTYYGKDFFPEPLLAEEGELEKEFRTTWLHAEGAGAAQDAVSTELEDSFGLFTFEAEGNWERDVSYDTDPLTDQTAREMAQGLASFEINVRHPVLQYVSDSGNFDDTLVAGMSVAVPTHTPVSEDFELEPQAWNMLRLGDHWTVQTRVAYSALVGGGDDGDLHTFEYAATLGYTADLHGFPVFREITPLAELDGFDPLNHSDAGNDQLQGVVGCQLGVVSASVIQPKISVGYTFPIDAGARRDFQWGIVTSLIFDF